MAKKVSLSKIHRQASKCSFEQRHLFRYRKFVV